MKYILLILVLLFTAQTAQAHFIVETQNREIHVLTDKNMTRVILRFPLTLAYANELAQRAPDAHFTAPFMKTELVRGRPYYQLDNAAISKDYGGFVRFLLRDFRFSLNGAEMQPEKLNFTVIDTHAGCENSGDIAAGLIASMNLLSLCVADIPDQPYIIDTLIVISFYLPKVGPTDPLKIELDAADFPVPEGKYFETRIADHRGENTKLLTYAGASFEPVVLNGSLTTSFIHFVKQGVHHILTGYDHVLFVLCLVLAAASLRLLIWSVTGFTLGHSITLAAGVFGFVPQGAWFIPLIELFVAISILLMGALILLRRSGRQGFWLAGAIGLLHGFGFSFMLADMLGGAGSTLAVALAGFNIGVEIGQLAIVIIAFLVLRLAAKLSNLLHNSLRYGVAAFACIIALMMMFERSEILMETLNQTETL